MSPVWFAPVGRQLLLKRSCVVVHSITHRLKLSALALALALSVGACTSTTEQPTTSAQVGTAQAFSALTMTTDQYQQLVNESSDADRFAALVLLTRSTIVARDYAGASELLRALRAAANEDPVLLDQARIIEGLLYMHQGQTTDALFTLNKVQVATLPVPAASFYYQVLSNVELNLYHESKRTDYLVRSCEHKLALMQYVNEQAQQTVALQVVATLKQLPPSELTVLMTSNTDARMQGFIDFALIDSSKSLKLKQQLIANWQEKYEEHPLSFAAAQIAAGSEAQVQGGASGLDAVAGQVVGLKEGDKLAVLLPLTGRFSAAVGEPARLGVLAALQDRNSKLKVTFYDTNRMTMEEITSALVQNGTNFIIGPILKPEVDALIATKIELPAIVFNNPASSREGLYYYNLGPDYEGALAAAKIYHDGHTNPVLIAPESTRGERAIAGFNDSWLTVNTHSPISCRYNDINLVASALTTCPLNNADAIYINATASDVIRIRPSLPDNTPLYLTDRSYMGLNHSSGEIALAGAQLGDMPWLLTDSALKQDLMATLPKADSQVQRIFAAAYDSINLSFNLETLARDRNDVLHGISGDLQLGQDGLIEMAPMWVTLDVNRPVQ